MDRAGLVGEDGETHMGLYDIAYMLAVPNMTVTAPKDSTEMLGLMRAAAAHTSGPFCLRYPRDTAPDDAPAVYDVQPPRHASWEVLRRGKDVAILAVGTMVLPAIEAARDLAKEGLEVTVVNCRYLKPFDEVTLDAILANHRRILTVEEGTMVNGFGAFMAGVIARRDSGVRVSVLGVPDRIIYAASRKKQLAQCGLDPAGIAIRVRALLESEAMAG
jgi:1-deoxy-D-xylulose-5-phosphate synthase